MIFLKVLVNIPLLLSNLFTQIERAEIILQDLPVASVRAEDGFVVGDYLLKDRGNDSYDKAKEICATHRETLFQLENDMDIREVFSNLPYGEVWTDLLREKETNKVMDLYGYAPLVLIPGQDDMIIDSQLITPTVLATLSAKHHIALKKEIKTETEQNDRFSYIPAPDSLKKGIICVSSLKFPYTKKDQSALSAFYTQLTAQVTQEKNSWKQFEDSISTSYKAFPLFTEKTNIYTFDNMTQAEEQIRDELDMETNLEIKILELENIMKKAKMVITNIKTSTDALMALTIVGEWKNSITEIQNHVRQVIKDPISLITPKLLAKIVHITDVNLKTTTVRVGKGELRIKFEKDYTGTQSSKNVFSPQEWKQFFSSVYWTEFLESLSQKRFFAISLWNILGFSFNSSLFILTMVLYFRTRWLMKKFKKQQSEQLKVFQIKTRKEVSRMERAKKRSEGSPIQRSYPTTLPRVRKTKHEPKTTRRDRSAREPDIPLYLAESFLSLNDSEAN